MARVFQGRYTADIDGDFVVFMIGMRINKPWDVRGWWPTFAAMRPMLRELEARPELGLMKAYLAWIGGPAAVQYWRSFEQLDRFARARDLPHLPAWREWNRTARASGAVAIWHETYKVRAAEYETVYGNMTRFGLAAAADHVPVVKKGRTAARRIGATTEDVPALPYPGDEVSTIA
ncbi:MAG TPA: DUF4188 domain-containing protein [Solirubrobacteraceae bacterium]|jgi:hypothetical protein|nr:DUF4188 domain-containing protein [Solirubrobacteraceae bacterium]